MVSTRPSGQLAQAAYDWPRFDFYHLKTCFLKELAILKFAWCQRTQKKVLKEVGLKFGLDYEVKNSGKNISIGERQLLSLSRALIANTKIILFDEATAGIDPENDRKIQEVIKGKFKDCTILTIAHRLGTILESDLVVLLGDGKVVEIGEPKELMNKDSEFKSLAEKMH